MNWTEASSSVIDDESVLFATFVQLRGFNGRFLAVVDQHSIWASDDGLHWQPTLTLTDYPGIPASPGEADQIVDLAVGKQRAIALGWDMDADAIYPGTLIWTSDNGIDWQRLPDPSTGLGTIATTQEGFIALGGGGVLRSADGTAWQRATDDASRHIGQTGGRLFTVQGETVAFSWTARHIVELWRANDAGWTKLAVLPDSQNAWIEHMTVGPQGWLAFGGTDFWTSKDGTDWLKADLADVPQHATVESVVGLDAGFVAVGYSGDRPGIACGSGEPLVAHTWTSIDGMRWAEMDQSLPGVRFVAAYARNADLFALAGVEGANGGGSASVWTAPIPPIARAADGVVPIREPGVPIPCGPYPSPSASP